MPVTHRIKPSQSALTLAVALASGLVALPASAKTETGASYDNYVYFGGFLMRPDRDRGSEGESYGYQAGIGHRLGDRLWIEGQFFGDIIETGKKFSSDFYQTGAGVDVAYAFGQRSEFTPYLVVGLGGVRNETASTREITPYLNAGIGFTKAILGFDNLRFRGEFRTVYDDYLQGKVDYRLGAGLEFALGGNREPEVVTREVQVPVEKVVEVPVEKVVIREVPVERIVIKEVPAPVAETPAPAPVVVETRKVSVDDDGDGVINDRDRCPNTLKGARVDGNGCVVEQTLTIRDITFEYNSARLTVNAQRLMENVVAFLRSDASIRISISGHTDNRGSDSYNLKLSRDRANEVRDYLIGYGIDASRLEAAGYGESRPVASNDSDAGRELNRRVEFRIQK